MSPGAWTCFWWTSKWILMECSGAEHVGFRADLSFSGVNGKRKAELQAITVLLSSMHCAWKLLFISLLAECVKCVSALSMSYVPFLRFMTDTVRKGTQWQGSFSSPSSFAFPSSYFFLTVGFHSFLGLSDSLSACLSCFSLFLFWLILSICLHLP